MDAGASLPATAGTARVSDDACRTAATGPASRAIERMVEHAPATGGLALWMRHVDAPEGDRAPPASTDGHVIAYAPSFAALPLEEQAGWVAHEVLHVALRHPQRLAELRARFGDVDAKLFATCADAIVNASLAHLAWLRLPAGAPMLDALLLATFAIHQDVGRSLLEWDVERLYRAIDDRLPASGDEPRRDGPRATRVRALGAGTPIDLRRCDDGRDAPQARATQAHEWAERLVRAHAGDGAHSMLRALLADLPRPRTPWEQALRVRLARALAAHPEDSWSRPSRSWLANRGRAGPHRRMPWEPGRVATRRVPRLAVVVDVSGSIDEALLARFAAELDAITRRAEAGLVLVVGDDRVRHVEQRAPGDSGLRQVRFDGGGGTDFTPLLEAADAHRPDVGVVLTDLEGPARFRPRWPVVWAVPASHAGAVAPFGRTLVLD
jgi:predicted metal-dependent peptidase